jgi:hypothetical protein
MRVRDVVAVIVAATASQFTTADRSQAQSTTLFGTNHNPYCQDVDFADFLDVSCPTGSWTLYMGRVAWWPLRYVGPIMISVDSRRGYEPQGLPLYVECVPLATHPPGLGYCDGVGTVIMRVRGHTECDAVETGGPFDLSYMLSPGDLYVIRAYFLSDLERVTHSPYFRSIRVEPAPMAIEPATWGMVKGLYRTP